MNVQCFGYDELLVCIVGKENAHVFIVEKLTS